MSTNDSLVFPNKYFEDEVRAGFFVPAQIKQEWAAALEVLHAIDRVCREHGIQYFADWGTLLATVRHQGYIPWDDDIDIVMKRADYKRFLEIAKQELPAGYDIQNFQTRDDCWLFLTRIINKDRICFEEDHLEQFHQFPYIVSVDIFVLDYVCVDEEREQQRNQEVLHTIALADALADGVVSTEAAERWFLQTEKASGQKIDRTLEGVAMRRQLYGIAQSMFERFSEAEAKELTQLFPFGLKDKRFRFPKEYYDKSIRLPYENTTIEVPLYYEKMLRKRYGDYMRLVRTWDSHEYPYYQEQIDNLKKILDFELPEYKFFVEQLREHRGVSDRQGETFKELVAECIHGMEQLTGQAVICVRQCDWEGVFQNLQESQQLAIDLGTMIEQVRGEGHICVSHLETFCESVYEISLMLDEYIGKKETVQEADIAVIAERLNNVLQLVQQSVEDNIFQRREVVFLPYKAEYWETMADLWRTAEADSRTDVYVVPIPYYYKNFDGSVRAMAEEQNGYPAEVELTDYHSFDLEFRHPDVIYFQNPYDEWNPATSVLPQFYSSRLQQATDCLIYADPYMVEDFTAEDGRAYTNLSHYVTRPGVVRADEVIVPSEAMRKMYISRLAEFAGEETRGIWEKKIHVSDELAQKDAKSTPVKRKKVIAYYINASFLVEHQEAGIQKIERSFQVFEANKEGIEVIYCEHNQLETATGMESEELWERYLGMMEKYRDCVGVTVISEQTDIHEVVSKADAFYGDGGCLALEMSLAGKPVMIQDVRY